MTQLTFSLEPFSASRLLKVCGNLNQNLKLIEKRLEVEIFNRGNQFELHGDEIPIQNAKNIIEHLYLQAKTININPELVHLYLQEAELEQIYFEHNNNLNDNEIDEPHQAPQDDAPKTPQTLQKNTKLAHNSSQNSANTVIKMRKVHVKARGENQQNYVQRILHNAVNFGIGPAGTGKTYLAVACAVQALEQEQVKRILLVRPAVEAGEKLGFLPGDLAQKIDPYLRPLYDALYEFLGFETVAKLIDKQIIEVAPLAYMRGRTLNHSFIILDESQNTTPAQMKMFLTRLGFGSTAVITGDITQVDLPPNTLSGLKQASQILGNVKGVTFTNFSAKDVVRHELVAKIIEAYDVANC